MGRFKIIQQYGNKQEILKEYDNIEDVIKDMQYRHPYHHFIGDGKTREGYTLKEFKEKFL